MIPTPSVTFRASSGALILLGLLLAPPCSAPAQDFVRRSGTTLTRDSRPFYAVGVNSYFLQHLAATGDTAHLHEVLREAADLGCTTIRTWAFHDARDSSNPAAIQWGPGLTNEAGLAALDLVIALAGRYGLALILPLVNNWDDYGGMNMYVQWYADRFGLAGEAAGGSGTPRVYGTGGRSYAVTVAPSLTHDDFYRIPLIREWYRTYAALLVDRVNTVTGTRYRDDPAILMWELANEPRSSDPTGTVVYEWLAEMSAFVRSIDPNHLIATGEEGLDCNAASYSPADRYNGRRWLFDGTGGVSFTRNLTLPHVDAAALHCYPEAWGLSFNQGLLWIRDHRRIAHAAAKPLILGEVGSRTHAAQFLGMLFTDAYYGNSAGMVPWQFIYDERPFNDGYAFRCPLDADVCGTLRTFATRFEEKRTGVIRYPDATSLLQSYPNPFNEIATIMYTLREPSWVRVSLFTTLGRRIAMLVDEEQAAGEYRLLLEGRDLASGTYFLHLDTPQAAGSCKIVLIR